MVRNVVIKVFLICNMVFYVAYAGILHNAVYANQLNVVKELINRGEDVNQPLPFINTTPLEIAAFHGFFEIAQALLSAGAHASSDTSRYKTTPLHAAASSFNQQGAILVVDLLLKHGVNLYAQDIQGTTPKGIAQQRRFFNVMDLCKYWDGGMTQSCHPCDTVLHLAVRSGDLEEVKRLLSNCASENLQNYVNQPLAWIKYRPLHVAAIYGRTEMVQLLLQAGARIDARARYGLTPLHYAVQRGSCDTIKSLLNGTSSVVCQQADILGDTPLHFAAASRTVAILKILLASTNETECQKIKSIRNKNGQTPFDVAVQYGREEAVLALLR